jgi:hypothetical protein
MAQTFYHTIRGSNGIKANISSSIFESNAMLYTIWTYLPAAVMSGSSIISERQEVG